MVLKVLGYVVFFCFCMSSCDRKEASSLAASPIERHMIGLPGDIDSGELDSIDLGVVAVSYPVLRSMGWAVGKKIFKPQPLKDNESLSIPQFLSWYTSDELVRMFRNILQNRKRLSISMGEPITEQEWVHAQNWNISVATDLFESELSQLQDTVRTSEDALSLNSPNRIFFNPSAAFHLISHHQNALYCLNTEWPENMVEGELVDFISCFDNMFPQDAMIAKASWYRLQENHHFPVYLTHSRSMKRRWAEEDWSKPDALILKFPDSLYKAKSRNGDTFALVGAHVMSKKLTDWMWISYWWAEDSDQDFGVDRPHWNGDESFKFKSYKMCVVSEYSENQELAESIQDLPLGLADVMTSLRRMTGASTWCSNPYLEEGHQNQKTNCIGCHQHAGSHESTDHLLASETTGQNPLLRINQKVRNNFPTDYVWAADKISENILLRLSDVYWEENSVSKLTLKEL